MKRIVPVLVADPNISHLAITPIDIRTETAHPNVYAPVPQYCQLTGHLRDAVAALEAEALEERDNARMYAAGTSSRRKHGLRASSAQQSADAIRAAFHLDEEVWS